MTDRWKNILIGSFVASALAIGVMLVFFLKPTIGDGKHTLQVRFTNISGINSGTRVTYAGKPVGEVAKISQIPNARIDALDKDDRVYSYQLTLRYDSRVKVYETDEIAIRTTGLMGEKSIAILPKSCNKDTPLAKNCVFYANSVDPLDNTITRIGKVAAKAEQSIDRFDGWFDQNAPVLSHAIASVGGAAQSLDGFLCQVHDTSLVPAVKNSVDVLTDNMKLVRSAFVDDEMLSRLSVLISDLSQTAKILNTDGALALNNIDKITRDLATGSGTLGRFIKNDDFYLRLNSLMSKSETMMNDINHFGILFQYNKSWQRSRTKRATLLKSLDSPEEFKTYFEGEIDSINVALGRIGELMNRAEQDDEKIKIVQNDAFRRDFAVLLRQVQSLGDSLKLYNQALVAQLDE
jgi:phospholipid/cholesterol/gamma-HCH transport system substrate-binding protein